MKTPADMPDFRDIDKKQQDKWQSAGVFKAAAVPGAKKFYCLDMFPYPSGEGMHVGHAEGYTASDIFCRFKRMNGFDVLHPMGWDAFGLPAENYAISTGVHPRLTTKNFISKFRRQIDSLGLSYDWSREINTTDPDYYRWTQWIFLQIFKKGLAYEATVPINWCPKCKTGLANEEVFGGKCDRCETPIEKKNLKQWMLRITAYADRLLADLEGINWPHSTMLMQQNWIGRSEGAEVDFELPGTGRKLTVFTTRPDTLYGATYMVLAPEHPLLESLTTAEHKAEVAAYVAASARKSDLERAELSKEKTGVFTGAYAVNPVNGKKLPVWTADYVLTTYGAGAIMAVPAHDERDWEFAKKFGLKIIEVVKTPEGWPGGKAFCETGISVNSPAINGLPTPEATKKMTAWLEEKGLGRAKVNFKLRDWVFSRQRYWGEPIPLVHCPKCGAVPVPESELPLLLPEVEKYQPTGTGESPLALIDSWVNARCPACGGPAKRETNTMPQWAGSCWYYLRFIDSKNSAAFVDSELEKAWMPVDLYIGGSEHAVLHLLYARFWHKVLHDLGLVSTREPFKKLIHQGMILSYSYRDSKGVYRAYGELDIKDDGSAVTKADETIKPVVEKMSKSKKNVINPDEIVAYYGADAFRMYEMFMGPLEDAKPWDMRGIEGMHRFLKRVWAWGLGAGETAGKGIGEKSEVRSQKSDGFLTSDLRPLNSKLPLPAVSLALSAIEPPKDLLILRHQTIAKVTADLESLKFNTAISALMIYFNRLSAEASPSKEDFSVFMRLLHPLAPHITDELWERSGGSGTLMKTAWPRPDAAVISERDIEVPVQVNGKLKARLKVKETTGDKELERLALESAAPYMAGKTVVKVIVVKNRLVSIVIK